MPVYPVIVAIIASFPGVSFGIQKSKIHCTRDEAWESHSSSPKIFKSAIHRKHAQFRNRFFVLLGKTEFERTPTRMLPLIKG